MKKLLPNNIVCEDSVKRLLNLIHSLHPKSVSVIDEEDGKYNIIGDDTDAFVLSKRIAYIKAERSKKTLIELVGEALFYMNKGKQTMRF